MTEPKTAEVKVVPVEPTKISLEPCPFCGNRPDTQSFWYGCAPGDEPRGYHVFCLECSETDALDGPRRDTLDEAIAAWNTRAAPSHIGEAAGMVAPAQSESIHDAARRLFAKEYPGRDYERIDPGAQMFWMEAAWDERAAPGSPAEKGEGSARERLESLADDFDTLSVRTKYDAYDRALFIAARDDLREIRAMIATHPASHQSDTERMRALREGWAAEMFDAGHTVSQRSWTDADVTEEQRDNYRRAVDRKMEKVRAALAEKEADQ